MPLISLNEDTVKRIELLGHEEEETHDEIVNRVLDDFWRRKKKSYLWEKTIQKINKSKR